MNDENEHINGVDPSQTVVAELVLQIVKMPNGEQRIQWDPSKPARWALSVLTSAAEDIRMTLYKQTEPPLIQPARGILKPTR